jgi:glycogen(starch) synthase
MSCRHLAAGLTHCRAVAFVPTSRAALTLGQALVRLILAATTADALTLMGCWALDPLVGLTHLVLSPLFPPARFGGIEKIVEGLCRALAATGDQVVVLAGGGAEHAGPLSVDRVLADESLRVSDGNLVIHAHDWFMTRAAAIIVRTLKAPLLAFFHGDKSSEYGTLLEGRKERIHRLQRELADRADAIVCYSHFMQRCIAASLAVDPTRVTLFKCGGDEDVPIRRAMKGTTRTILYMGRLAPEKDVATLIDAFRLLCDQGISARLSVVGSGSTEPALRERVAARELSEWVTFRPFTCDPNEVEREFSAADVLVLPSTFEPLGMIILEAMAREVPVVATDAGGPRELIDNEVTGWLFPPCDASALADRLARCLANRERTAAVARAARAYVLREHRWRDAADRVRGVAARTLASWSCQTQGAQ